MQGPASRHPVDYELLAELLAALAYPTRLELLGKLRFPHTLSEIRVSPAKVAKGENPDRPAAKQTVQRHLDKLLEADLIQAGTVERQGREMPQYTANPARLYAVLEELRSLIVRYAGLGLSPEHTATLEGGAAREKVTGPRLVLVHGVYEGRAYPLDRGAMRDGAWTIGRAQDVAISLDYDPFVSTESAEITRGPGGFVLTDLGSKNGTWLNWELLRDGEERPLEPGDIIGVGRSLLSYVASSS